MIDEHGEVTGLLTLTDLLEALVGDLGQVPGTSVTSPVQREDAVFAGSISDRSRPRKPLMLFDYGLDVLPAWPQMLGPSVSAIASAKASAVLRATR